MKRKFLPLAVLSVLVVAVGVCAQSFYEHQHARYGTDATATVNVQYTDYGSYIRSCSTGSFTSLDSGGVLTTIMGIADLRSTDALYLSIDSAGGPSDTGISQKSLLVLKAGHDYYGSRATPFWYSVITAVDSNVDVPSRVAAFAAGGGSHAIVVHDVVITVELLAGSIN